MHQEKEHNLRKTECSAQTACCRSILRQRSEKKAQQEKHEAAKKVRSNYNKLANDSTKVYSIINKTLTPTVLGKLNP